MILTALIALPLTIAAGQMLGRIVPTGFLGSIGLLRQGIPQRTKSELRFYLSANQFRLVPDPTIFS